jgi:hypothetical protein
MITPHLVRRVLLPASYSVFLAGILASAAIFFRDKPLPFSPTSSRPTRIRMVTAHRPPARRSP